MNIQWYPGHMTKAKRQLQPKIKLIDLVIEILDARLPLGSQNPDFNDILGNKRRFYVLNKSDLADEAVTARWLKYFKGSGSDAAAYSARTGNADRLFESIARSVEHLTDKYKGKGINKTVRAMVIGIPNVGKSAILNRLSGTRKMKEGNMPGVTKGLQWAKITPYFEIMDTPGILMPKIEDEETAAKIALIGCIKQEILDEEELGYYLIKILSEMKPALLSERYKLDEIPTDPYEVLCEVCRKRGFLLRGGELDTERGAKTVLDEFKNGKMGRISLETPK